jgi:hypothetical protein
MHSTKRLQSTMAGISDEAYSVITPILACGTENWDDNSFVDGSVISRGRVYDSLTELNGTELHTLVAIALSAMQSRGLSPPLAAPSPTSKPDIHSNTRFEQMAYAGLSSKYDGSPDNLIPP